MKKLLLYLFIIATASLNGQDISVNAWFDTSRIYIGDQIYYNIEIIQPKDITLSASYPSDRLDSLIRIISKFDADTLSAREDYYTLKSKYLVTSFDTGSYDVKPFFVEYMLGDSLVRYYSDFAHLDVIRTGIAPIDSAEVFDIIGPYKERLTFTDLAPWLFLLIVLSLALYYIIRRIRSKRKMPGDESPNKMPGEPLHIVILRDLDKLERMQLWQKGEIKEFYSRLTEILRHFLELKYSFPSLEMTSTETLESLVKIGFKRDNNFDLIENILTTADMSKFAKLTPGAEINGVMIERSKEFVINCCRVNIESLQSDTIEKGEEVSDE